MHVFIHFRENERVKYPLYVQADIDTAVQLLLKLKVDYKKLTGQDYKAGCPPTDNVVQSDNGPASEEGDDLVDPWTVSTNSAKGVDYDKLIGRYTYCNQRDLV